MMAHNKSDTGRSTNPDGSKFRVRVRHQAFLQHEGKDYLMTIFSDWEKRLI